MNRLSYIFTFAFSVFMESPISLLNAMNPADNTKNIWDGVNEDNEDKIRSGIRGGGNPAPALDLAYHLGRIDLINFIFASTGGIQNLPQSQRRNAILATNTGGESCENQLYNNIKRKRDDEDGKGPDHRRGRRGAVSQ